MCPGILAHLHRRQFILGSLALVGAISPARLADAFSGSKESSSEPSYASDMAVFNISARQTNQIKRVSMTSLEDVTEDQGVLSLSCSNNYVRSSPIRRGQCLIAVSVWPCGTIMLSHIYRSLAWSARQCEAEASHIWKRLNYISRLFRGSQSHHLGELSVASTLLVYLGRDNALLDQMQRNFNADGSKVELWGDPNWRYSGLQVIAESKERKVILSIINPDGHATLPQRIDAKTIYLNS